MHLSSSRLPRYLSALELHASLAAKLDLQAQCAVLLANNLRDIDQDRVAGKRTLSVLIGRRATQVLYTVFVLVPFGIAGYLAVFYPIAWLTAMALLLALPAILIVWTYRQPRELIIALALTSGTSLAFGAFLFWAFAG